MAILMDIAGWLLKAVGGRVVSKLTDRGLEAMGVFDATCKNCGQTQQEVAIPERRAITLTCPGCGHFGTVYIEKLESLTVHEVRQANILVHNANIAIMHAEQALQARAAKPASQSPQPRLSAPTKASQGVKQAGAPTPIDKSHGFWSEHHHFHGGYSQEEGSIFAISWNRQRQFVYVQLREHFPSDLIKVNWDAGYRIVGLDCVGAVWLLQMSRRSPFSKQTYLPQAKFPEASISEKWAQGYHITHVTYGPSYWVVVVSKGSPYSRQTWKTAAKFPADWIQQRWAQGYRITSLSYGDSLWAVVMSQGSSLTAQTWRTHSRFPLASVQELWTEGKLITSMAFGENLWAVVLSAGSGSEWQAVSLGNDHYTSFSG